MIRYLEEAVMISSLGVHTVSSPDAVNENFPAANNTAEDAYQTPEAAEQEVIEEGQGIPGGEQEVIEEGE